MEAMSGRAYARRVGLHHSTVQQAIASGRIPATHEGLIDAEATDRAWRANTCTPETRNAKRNPKRARAAGQAPRASKDQGSNTPQARRGGSRTAERRRLARILAGLVTSRAAADMQWLEVMDEREQVITQAAERAIEELPPVLVGKDEDEMRDAMTEALDRALFAAEEDWRRRYR